MLKRTVFITALVFIMALPCLAQGVDLPQTGQTTCYDTVGAVIACPGTGQDGDWQAGVAWPSPRFTDIGDGTVTDNLTGLIWLKNANCADGTGVWETALGDVAQLNTDGTMSEGNNCGDTSNGGSHQTDWRLPNVNELESLINAAEANTATWLNGQGFTSVKSYFYWSSSTYAVHTDYAWIVRIDGGEVGAYVKDSLGYIWPVRAATTPPAELWKTGQTASYAAGDDGDLERGVAWPSLRFTDIGDGTVTDNLTGLIWLQNANCFGAQTWANALNSANTLNTGDCGLADGSVEGAWRLPNRKELRSLADYSQFTPALPSDHRFTNVQSFYYWSSTTDAHYTDYAWSVNMDGGLVYSDNKTYDGYYVWPVRAGTLGNSDISVTKTDSPDPVTAGSNLTYTITVANNGPSPATGVRVIDRLPRRVTFVSAAASQGRCKLARGRVNCDLGAMANGGTATVTIVVTPMAAGTLRNTASVTSSTTDPNSANNRSTAITTVQQR